MNEETMNESNLNKGKKKNFIKVFPAYLPVKLLSVLGLAVSLGIVFVCAGMAVSLMDEGFYRYDHYNEILDERFESVANLNARQIISYLDIGEIESANEFLNERNIAAMIVTSKDPKYSFEYYCDMKYRANDTEPYSRDRVPTKYVYSGMRNEDLAWKIYLIPELDKCDDAYTSARGAVQLSYKYRYMFFVGIGAGVLLFLFCLCLFISGIGKSSKTGEVEENYFTMIPFDLVTVFLGFFACMGLGLAYNYSAEEQIIGGVIAFTATILWSINLIHRVRLKNVFRNTLCFMFFRFLGKLFVNIPLIWKSVLILTGISLIEFFTIIVVSIMVSEDAVFFLMTFALFAKNIILHPIILYIVLMMKNLFKAGEELASGNSDYKISTGSLIGEYRKHAENLNNISGGINKAVEERMKSERMKTELITNVSHDLKTPLTSIINYSDLIQTEAGNLSRDYENTACEITKEGEYDTDTDNGMYAGNGIQDHISNIEEYSEVLNRQSGKLKRLLEDIVDISKASSGNMEVTMEKLEVGTMLSQAAGEYEERFAQKNLEVILSNPEKEMYISADSRKLWRVFDNLLQNIYKYAHPDTRVFLSTNEKGEKVEIIFRNTSDEIISVSADELTERFTRGDESRHKEGNGLGLAIAKSMIDLQGGEFNISVDGDLFKVTLLLNKYAEPETKLSASP